MTKLMSARTGRLNVFEEASTWFGDYEVPQRMVGGDEAGLLDNGHTGRQVDAAHDDLTPLAARVAVEDLD